MRSGLRGEMTYYELGGAKVFAAGTLNFRRAACYFPPSSVCRCRSRSSSSRRLSTASCPRSTGS